MHTLEIKGLTAGVDHKTILKDFNLTIHSGEIHAIMGPNGTGKSTLSKVIMGAKDYIVEDGDILYDGKSILSLSTDERARLGIFLGMQLPIEIEGVTNADFLRTAIHQKEQEQFKLFDFIKNMDRQVENLHMDKEMIHRSINVGFSGGERKKNEILQMYLLKPDLIILDEIDSGLDVDSLRIVGEKVMAYFKEYKPAILVITHYQRLLNYIVPNFVHIIKDGNIIQSGDASLVKKIEEDGYESIKKRVSSTCIVRENINHE